MAEDILHLTADEGLVQGQLLVSDYLAQYVELANLAVEAGLRYQELQDPIDYVTAMNAYNILAEARVGMTYSATRGPSRAAFDQFGKAMSQKTLSEGAYNYNLNKYDPGRFYALATFQEILMQVARVIIELKTLNNYDRNATFGYWYTEIIGQSWDNAEDWSTEGLGRYEASFGRYEVRELGDLGFVVEAIIIGTVVTLLVISTLAYIYFQSASQRELEMSKMSAAANEMKEINKLKTETLSAYELCIKNAKGATERANCGYNAKTQMANIQEQVETIATIAQTEEGKLLIEEEKTKREEIKADEGGIFGGLNTTLKYGLIIGGAIGAYWVAKNFVIPMFKDKK